MGLRDIISGKKKLAEPKADQLFALATAAITLQVELQLTTDGVGALTYKPQASGTFDRIDNDVDALVKAAARSAGGEVDRQSDSFGFDWLIVHDADLEDQLTGVHAAASEMTDQGFGSLLLAAAFRFKGGPHPVYWIYGFKQGTFWPFIPTGENERDNATELELKAKLEKELPIEQDLTKWLALFGLPL